MASFDLPVDLRQCTDYTEDALPHNQVTQPGRGSSDIGGQQTRMLLKMGFSLNAQSKTDVATFLDFYDNDLTLGRSDFNWTHPRTGLAHEGNFAGQRPFVSRTGPNRFNVSFTIYEV